jgi:hypothetical protein
LKFRRVETYSGSPPRLTVKAAAVLQRPFAKQQSRRIAVKAIDHLDGNLFAVV